MDSLGCFHFDQMRMLDSNGGDIGHHGQKVQVVVREKAGQIGQVDVEQADHRFASLQRDGDDTADALLNDALPLGEIGIR